MPETKTICVLCGERKAEFKICSICLHSKKILDIITKYDLDINSKKFEKVLLALILIERGA